MEMKDYRDFISADILMGPNSVRILKELLDRHPLRSAKDGIILDLGCGKGITSLALARYTGAKVCAVDLWIAAEENAERFAKWGVEGQVTPVHADANELNFDRGIFSGLVSVDSYHYYGGEPDFFEQKMMPFLADGAEVLIGIPGIRNEFSGRSDELLSAWLGDEAYMFKSADMWKEIIGIGDRIGTVEAWEMDCFDDAWNDWFATGHKFAAGDMKFFDKLIKPYTCFVGIYIKLK